VVPGGLEQLEQLRDVGPGTGFRLQAGAVFRVSAEGDEAVVVLGTRLLRMPGFVLPALTFVAEHEGRLTLEDLPGPLDEGSRLVLLRRLVREGALEVVGAAG
jgi:hypothetical protein